jgi:4-amino-4-deoxy-L-arabinose transferase-like glycosyltransferase
MLTRDLSKGQATPPLQSVRPRRTGPASTAWRHRFLVLGLVVVASFALRVGALKFWGTGAIESEGAEYARIAENLRKGVGYVGIATPGPELLFPPLLPLLISGASLATGSYVRAGRLVSLVLGTLLPLPVFGIASRLFSRRVGLIAAALTILHPLLVNLSFTVLSEGPYATLLLSAVYVVLLALERPSLKMWALVGGVFGVAYLLRQEAVVPLMIAVLFALTATEGKFAARCKRAVAALTIFTFLALPEVVFIYRSTGKVRLEGKSAIFYALGTRILAREAVLRKDHLSPDVQYAEAKDWTDFAINADLEATGIWMRSNAEVIQKTRMTLKDATHLVQNAGRRSIPTFVQYLSARWFSAPFLTALVLLGAMRRPWRRPQITSRLFVALVPVSAILATLSALWSTPRFYFVLLPFLLIWAGNGLFEVGLWIKTSSAAAGWSWLSPQVSEYVIPSFIGLLAVVAYPLNGVRDLYDFAQGSPSSQVVKEAGLWVGRQQDRPVKIMDLSTPLALHADAQYVHFPYCSGDLALRFLDSAKVDYVVLRRNERFSQYYADWFARGIPDPRAQLVYASSGVNAGDIVVFRWHRADSKVPELPKPIPVRIADTQPPSLPTAGPLRVDPRNPRYFADKHGNVVLLAGSHTWENLQDAGRLAPVPFDYGSYLNYLVANGHNFMRLYSWEQANWALWRPYDWRIWPNVFRRTGPGNALDGGLRFNLDELDLDYFERLRSRVKAARDRGIYVAIMLFNGFSIERKGEHLENPWRGHPFNSENNINGIDGDENGDGEGREIHSTPNAGVVHFQEKYVAGVIDAVSDLDNVLYEISNEDQPGSMAWQRHMVGFIRRYESTKGVRHPVGITSEYPGGKNEDLFAGPADWIAPNPENGYDHDPPPATGNKVIVADTDHIYGTGGDRVWVWKSLTRGLNVLLMDPYDNVWNFPPLPVSQFSQWSELRRSIGYARLYLSRLNLSTMVPRGELATTHYCLADPTSGVYLVYVPTLEAVEVDTSASTGMLQVEWFEPTTGKILKASGVASGRITRLMTPYAADAVLLLRASPAETEHKTD